MVMYQLAVETLFSPAAGLNNLPEGKATATTNSDIALFMPVALLKCAQETIIVVAVQIRIRAELVGCHRWVWGLIGGKAGGHG